MNSQENNKAVVEKFFTSLGKKEHSKYSDTYFHKEHKFHFPFFPEPLNVEAHKKMDEDFINGFPDAKIVVADLFATNDKVVLRASFTGTHKEEFNKIPPTGKRIDLPFIAIVKFKDGKNIEEWVEMDTIKMMKQLDVMTEQAS